MNLFKTLKNKMKTLNHNPITLEQNNQDVSIPTTKTERVKSFLNYAFQKAGLNNGDPTSLKTYLKWIKDGHIVDETYNEKEHQARKMQIEDKIDSKQEEKEKNQSHKQAIESVELPSCNEKIKGFESEIQQTKHNLAQNIINTGYQPIKLFTYTTLVILLSVYLILFYASVIYASFFRNAGSLIEIAGDDIALYLDSIFDIKGIFTFSYSLIIVYLGAFLFFAIGLIPHTLEGKSKNLKIAGAIFISFIVDSLLAYKIDKGIHDLKVMAGIADENWSFLTSINFYLVLAFGFLAYLVWGYMYAIMITEKDKKNGQISADLTIKSLKNEIKEQRVFIKELNTKVIELESQITILLKQIENLKNDLERTMLNPDLLSQSLTSFYMGWLQFLNSSTELELKKETCEIAYNQFMNLHFQTKPSIN